MIDYAIVSAAPAGYPVSVSEIKSHAIISHNADDSLIEQYLKAAITDLDPPNGFLGRAMREQTIIAYLMDFPANRIILPFPPLISVTSVKYKDSDGVEQTFSAAKYEVITGHEPGYISLVDGESWPTNLEDIESPVYIEFKAGYEDDDGDSTVPEGIKLYIMMLVSEMYRHREISTMAQVKDHWMNYIEKYRFHFKGWS